MFGNIRSYYLCAIQIDKMKNLTTTESPKLFLTDYASYNEGKQFEFGHWVDLSQFSDADEFYHNR